MEPLYSILTFPQRYEDGYLYHNIMVLPRNINLFKSYGNNIPSFAEADIRFESKIINNLDGLPAITGETIIPTIEILSEKTDKKLIYEEIIKQLESADSLKISDNPDETKDFGFKQQQESLGNIHIKKYLPHSYRNSFNFTSPRTKFAITDDEYECIIKNQKKEQKDVVEDKRYISWGKLIAFILRNPLLAERAGLIYKARIEIKDSLLKDGGWLYTNFAPDYDYNTFGTKFYACRIPKLKENRQIFAPVLFPVMNIVENNTTYDAVMQEAVLYNDGYAKIVHANQPINQDLLQENDSSNPPLKDIGIRLGWDDEQLTIWGNRQLSQKDEATELPIDAPLGVIGYKIDVRLQKDESEDDDDWHSQNLVYSPYGISFGEQTIIKADTPFELPVEVHPSSHGDTKAEGFWLPIYYVSWSGSAMVLPDKEAQEIHQLSAEKLYFEEKLGEKNALNTVPKKTFNPYLQHPDGSLLLSYGENYDFRIRLMDISGGGPAIGDKMLNGGQNQIATVHFSRNIAASALKIENAERFFQSQSKTDVKDMSILENILDDDNTLRIGRPDLSYPSVVYTRKYSDAVSLIRNRIENITVPNNSDDRREFIVGLPDPDVNSYMVTVEVKSLEMDNVLSHNGRESYILLEEKIFSIPNDLENENYDLTATLKIRYKDFDILTKDTYHEETVENELVLPTSRHLRITLTPLVDGASKNNDYASPFVREGKKTVLTSFKYSEREKNLLSEINGGLRAFYLQPEKDSDRPANTEQKEILKKSLENRTSVELQRLADSLNLTIKNLTLEGLKGSRAQFGISHQFRHSLAPDSASVSFSSVKELFNHWIIAVDYSLQRDWFWNALQDDSFTIKRSLIIEGKKIETDVTVGSVQMKDTASMSMIQGEVDRTFSRIIFLDVIDPEQLNSQFPREIFAEYTLIPNFQKDFPQNETDQVIPKTIALPITIIPHQIPRMVSVGLAMSDYKYDLENYRYSSERQKYLWFEFDSAPEDPNDTYYARILAHAPDPYLCRIDDALIEGNSEDAVFALNEEKIREIIPGMTNDNAGIGLMQELIPETSTSATKTYLLPLPPGLHANSDELFGFFTYEIRLGHKKESWSTAQGRYGRPLKVNGVQHPAPELVCSASRMQVKKNDLIIEKLQISAPFANAVVNGKNISASPPTTSLWYLLYTQVMQADGTTYRNILIDSGPMRYPHPSKANNKTYDKEPGNRLGTAIIPQQQISDKLEEMGLPKTNNLSVIAVEMFPENNDWQTELGRKYTALNPRYGKENETMSHSNEFNPLTNQLGSYRIYRSSVLTPISEICCVNC